MQGTINVMMSEAAVYAGAVGRSRRRRGLSLILGLGLLIFAVGEVKAGPYYVATTGSDGNNGSTWALAFKTISNGVANATTDGDVVWVSNGVYVVTTNITIDTKAITLRGQDRTNTIIQGSYLSGITNRGILIYNAGATVEEFTVTQCGCGSGAASDGGGVRVMSGTLQKCIITKNYANSAAGIYVYDATCLVTNCVITSNTASGGAGGVYINNGKVWNCIISDNSCPNNLGGGVRMTAAAAMLANSTVSRNMSSNHGAGCYISAGVISNCTIENNWIPFNSGYYFGAGIYGAGSGLKIYSSIIRNNSCYSYAGGGVGTEGSMLLQDCTINGNYSTNYGGGIMLSTGGSMLLTNCTINSNLIAGSDIDMGGAGINCWKYAHNGVTALWCRVVGNMLTNGGYGAGIMAGGSLLLDHCVIEKNLITNSGNTRAWGAGLYLNANSKAQVRNCLITRNTGWGMNDTRGGRGAGIYVEAASTNLFSACTVAGNFCRLAGGGVYLDGDGSDSFSNCIVSANTVTNPLSSNSNNIYFGTSARSNVFFYSCSDGLANTVQGNTTNGPVFVDAASGNWRLGRGSPCINAGTNESWMLNGVDQDSRVRIRYNAVDMGAYERIYEGTVFKAW